MRHITKPYPAKSQERRKAMDNAPEIVYKNPYMMDFNINESRITSDEIKYIRADIVESRIKELEKALENVKEFLDHIQPKVAPMAFNDIYSIVEEALKQTQP